MKKTVLGLFASLALVLGVGTMGSTAVAADSPYPATVKTTSTIRQPGAMTEGKTYSVRFFVTAGNAVVDEGTVGFVFGGKKFFGDIENGTAVVRVKAPKVSKTKYVTLKGYYKREGGSVFQSSNDSVKVKVKNKK
jgi:hypothetical protein